MQRSVEIFIRLLGQGGIDKGSVRGLERYYRVGDKKSAVG
jgi:hypothetical protein